MCESSHEDTFAESFWNSTRGHSAASLRAPASHSSQSDATTMLQAPTHDDWHEADHATAGHPAQCPRWHCPRPPSLRRSRCIQPDHSEAGLPLPLSGGSILLNKSGNTKLGPATITRLILTVGKADPRHGRCNRPSSPGSTVGQVPHALWIEQMPRMGLLATLMNCALPSQSLA